MERAYVTDQGLCLGCHLSAAMSLSLSRVLCREGEECVPSGLLHGANEEFYVRDLVICYDIYGQRVILWLQFGSESI